MIKMVRDDGSNRQKVLMMKNICMISQSPYPFDPRVRRQAEKLAAAGFGVDILCIPLSDEPEIEKFGENVTAFRIFRKRKAQESLMKYLWSSVSFFVLSFIKLQKLNRFRKYRLIQIHNMPETHVFTAILQKMQKVPILLDIHDLTPELLTSKWNNGLSRVLKPVIVFFEKISIRFSDHLITVTEGCREILVKRSAPPDKITLIINTANTSTFPFNGQREFKEITSGANLLYHGTVADRFGLHVIVEAMPAILKQIPGSVLRVYGKYDSNYKAALGSRIIEMGLFNNIFLEGSRTHEELYEIMKQSDIEVVPYISNEYMNLSLSTKIFECAASGLPIVATDLRTLRLTFDPDSITYAVSGDPGDFAEKIIGLCRDPSRRQYMVNNAHNAISRISGDVMEERYLSLIEKMTGIQRTATVKPEVKNMEVNG